jgi:hypothetical protein
MAGAYLPLEVADYNCDIEERTKAKAKRIKIPDVPTQIDKGFKECCYKNVVFGDLNSSEDYKNDFTGFFYERQGSSDFAVYKLKKVDTNITYTISDDTYGTYKPIGSISSNLNLSYFIAQWKKVLTLLGEGNYQIIKSVTIAGVSVDIPSNNFILEQFSIERANGTTRIDSTHNGRMLAYGVDFKNSGFKTSLRTRGFFGNNDPVYTQENLIYSNNEKSEQASIQKDDKYVFQMVQVPECITTEFFNFNLLGNELFISDYNKNNHSYELKLIPVIFQDNSGTKYGSYTRKAVINLTFENRYKVSRNINY